MYNFEKYNRQISLEDFGEQGQQKLSEASVVLVGAGGVGCGALPIIAGVGVGNITIFDYDSISLNNLHRQTIYTTNSIGLSKAEQAANFAKKLNPDCQVAFSKERFSEKSLDDISVDICIDATDSFLSRIAVAKACRKLGIRQIAATAEGFVSQNFLFGDGFYFDDIVSESVATEPSKSVPIFPASAHLSGIWAAGEAIKAIVYDAFEVGTFRMFDQLAMKYFSGNLK